MNFDPKKIELTQAKSRLLDVQKAIERAQNEHRIAPNKAHDAKPEIVAVSKFQPEAAIIPFLEAGHRHFGENRVQEAAKKWPALKKSYPNTQLHLIGPLQSNKAEEALELFDVIHVLDREKLAVKFASLKDRRARFPDLLIQVNTGREPQKAGVMPEEADNFIALCLKLRLPIKGLMCIPPANEPAGLHFGMLKTMSQKHRLPWLSMGMSADYPLASVMGATHLRIGTALFGERS